MNNTEIEESLVDFEDLGAICVINSDEQYAKKKFDFSLRPVVNG